MFGLIFLPLVSCDKKALEQDLDDAGISVTVNGSKIQDGQIVSVEKGTPITFRLEGDADYVTFFSGENGHKYINRERTFIDMEQIESSVLSFDVTPLYGNAANLFQMLVSEEFTGLYKNDFDKDVDLVENTAWGELIPQSELPQQSQSNPSTAVPAHFDVDMKPYFGKNVTLAIRYEGQDETQTQSRIDFKNMKIVTSLKNGTEIEISAGQFGFTPLNIAYYTSFTDAQRKYGLGTLVSKFQDASGNWLDDMLQYGSVTNGAQGLWRLDQIGVGTLQINSTPKKEDTNGGGNWPLNYSWLVSDYLTVNSCEPDKGVAVKNISTVVDTYEYTYNEVGTYTATFLLNNGNYHHGDSKVCNIIIDVK